ncbi:MAG: hypothetical protein ACFFCZ_09725 [Promethearchaeota archaeon]
MTDPTLDQINSLNADEIVKDLLRGWIHIRENYSQQIRRFYFNKQDKEELGQLAQELYNKYKDQQSSAQAKVVWDEGIFKQFFSVWLYGAENFSLLAYPYTLLMVESLNSTFFQQILQKCFSIHVDLDLFGRIFWQENRSVRARFSSVDLKLLKAFFNPTRILTVEASSSIDFPNALEIWRSEIGFSKSTAQTRYQRLLNLSIITRRSLINYAKLGLTPLLKIYNRTEVPSESEMLFCTWESPIFPEKTIRILVMPERSSFWFRHSARDVYILQGRYNGINIDSFDGSSWKTNHQLINSSSTPVNIPSPLWKMQFTSVNRFAFVPNDLKLLSELFQTPERQIKYLGPRAGLEDSGYIPKRLQQLRDARVFQTQFRLYNAGLNERYYVLAVGTTNDLLPIYQFICYLPQYYIAKAERCIYALLWLSSEIEPAFLDVCNYLKENLELKKLYYGIIDQGSKTHNPDLPNLWIEKRNCWKSEPED